MEENSKNKIIIIIAAVLFIAGIVLVIVNNNSKKNTKENDGIVFTCEKSTVAKDNMSLTIIGYNNYGTDMLKFDYKLVLDENIDDDMKQKMVDYVAAGLKQYDIETVVNFEGNNIVAEHEMMLSDYDETYSLKDVKNELESSGYSCK